MGRVVPCIEFKYQAYHAKCCFICTMGSRWRNANPSPMLPCSVDEGLTIVNTLGCWLQACDDPRPLSRKCIVFASDYVGKRVFQALEKKGHDDMMAFVRGCNGSNIFSGMSLDARYARAKVHGCY